MTDNLLNVSECKFYRDEVSFIGGETVTNVCSVWIWQRDYSGLEPSCTMKCHCSDNPNCFIKQLFEERHKADKQIVELNKTIKAKDQECKNLKLYMQEIRMQELSHLDIEWDEYETHCANTEYSNIINLVEEALEERSLEDCRYGR